MNRAWRHVVLGDATISEDSKRRPVKSSERVPGPYPYWGASGVVDHVDGYLFDYQTLLVSEDGENLRSRKTPIAFLVSGKYWVNNHAHVLRAKPDFDLRFLAYAVEQSDISGFITGSTQPKLTAGNLSKLPVWCPPLPEQRRIAGVLGAFDDLIEVNRKLMANLGDLIRAHFRSMMSMAEISTVPLFTVFDVDFGAAFKGDKFSEPGEGLPLLRIRDLKTHRSDTWTTERVKGDVLVKAGDVLIGMDAEFRPTYWLGSESLMNQRVCRVRPKVGSLAFARESLVEPMAFIEGHKTGTTVSHLNKADLSQTVIAVPDLQSLAQFDAISEPLRMAIVDLYQENVSLAAARDELLPLMVSGRVRAGDVAA